MSNEGYETEYNALLSNYVTYEQYLKCELALIRIKIRKSIHRDDVIKLLNELEADLHNISKKCTTVNKTIQ